MTVLRDVLAPELKIVFCGSAVGAASARRGAYYGGPGNAFWRTLFEVRLTPRQLQPEEYGRVIEFGLGLTDLAKNISGSDDVLRAEHFDREGLRAKIEGCRPKMLAFTSKRAAQEYVGGSVPYGLIDEKIGQTELFVLTSPSGAARRFWSIEPWRTLAQRSQLAA